MRFCYITQQRDYARFYAEKANGVIYRVRPDGPVSIDPTEFRAFSVVSAMPDWRDLERQGKAVCPITEFTCASATVLEVLPA